MPRLRQLSGSDIVAILAQFGFTIHSQKGSHIKLRRVSETGNETLIIPNHKRLDMGTCRGILRQASQYVSEDELAQYFYTE
jgi:predicted RNA binding protein YcfA (HicA-like mRNA interferase family)